MEKKILLKEKLFVLRYVTKVILILGICCIATINSNAQCSGTITNPNFADAIRTLYPTLIGPAGNDNLTSNAVSYTGTLDFSGWGNATTFTGAASSYSAKSKLTTIDGIECFPNITGLIVTSQNLTSIPTLPSTLKLFRCRSNNITSLPSMLPPSLDLLDCTFNALSSLPDLPDGLRYLYLGLNRLSSLPTLPSNLKYLLFNKQYSTAPINPNAVLSENAKTLTVLPSSLPSGLLLLNVTDNKLTNLPVLPSSMVYLQCNGNIGLTCLPELPANFFTTALPPSVYSGLGFSDPRLNISNTQIKCLPNLPSNVTSSKINPSNFANVGSLCITAPTLTATSNCSMPNSASGLVSINATIAGGISIFEYSKDAINYQSNNVFTEIGTNVQNFWARRKAASASCPTNAAQISVNVAECVPITYYVSPTGVDIPSGGTLANPWKTINYATTQVAVNQGHTIKLMPGIFEETSIITLPSGVNLIGDGINSSTIKVNSYYHLQDYPLPNRCHKDTIGYDSYDSKSNLFVIQVNGTQQKLKGFKLDGQNKQCHGGIFVKTGNNIVMDSLDVQNFNFSGIWVGKCTNGEIKNCFVKNNVFGNSFMSTGNIQYHDIDNFSMHDNLIIEDAVGGYGIKNFSTAWTNWCTWQFWNDNVTTVAENVKIYNNNIQVKEIGTWLSGKNSVPAISIEIMGMSIRNWEMYNNIIDNHISLVGNYYSSSSQFMVTDKSIRVHHNTFNLGNAYRYAAEMNMPNMEFDHNIINGGLYPLAQWQTTRDNWVNQSIHHNVFYDPVKDQPLIRYNRLPAGWKFYHNTIVDTKGIKYLLEVTNPSIPESSAEIKNNLYLKTGNPIGDIFVESFLPTVNDVSHNLMWNTIPFGKDSIVADPKLKMIGNMPIPFFDLGPNSPAIDAGQIIQGINDDYNGALPDIGAFETVGVTGIDISPDSSFFFNSGETLQLISVVTPNEATNKDIIWSTSDTLIAKVSETGLITAKGNGICTITATSLSGNKTATHIVSVAIPATAHLLGSATVCLGQSANLKINIKNGKAPFTITLNDGEDDIIISNYNSDDIITLHPNITKNYTISLLVDAGGQNGSSLTGNAFITVKAPKTPTNFLATIKTAKGRIELNWQLPNELQSSYVIERQTESNSFLQLANLIPTVNTFTDSTVSLSTNYSYRIYSKIDECNSAYSATTTAILSVVPIENVISPVRPVLECVSQLPDNTYRAYFGYLNENNVIVSIPVGNKNKFPPSNNLGQPTTFLTGRQYKAFSVPISSGNLVWILNGRTSTANKNSTPCSNNARVSAEANDLNLKDQEDVNVTSYPNPNNGYEIKLKGLKSDAVISLYNVSGGFISVKQSIDNQGETIIIPLNRLKEGMYILQISTEKAYLSNKLIVNYTDN